MVVARKEQESWGPPTTSSFKAPDIYPALREDSRKALPAAE
jgi:hypothetical protein